MNKLLTTALALAVASVTGAALADELKGDAQNGGKINAMCIGCHGIVGYQASFPQVYKVPMISGQSAKYIVAALNEYKSGARKHPTMRAQAASLTDQNIADLAAYYSTHAGETGNAPAQPAAQPGPVAAALLKAGNCQACHGSNFTTPLDPSYPKLAGQNQDYLLVALRSYLVTDSAVWGRTHATMGAQIKAVQSATSPKEFDEQVKAVAAYLSSLPGDLKVVPESRFR